MIRRSVWLIHIFIGVLAVAQQPKTNPAAHAALEFPVVLQENVVAGKTPVGTAVHSKLMLATLVKGVVVPQDAMLSGHVEESTAKTVRDPSRLKIRLDMAQWKGGSLAVNAFLTNMYYANRLVEMPAPDEMPDASTNSDLMLAHGGLPHQSSADLESRRAAWSRQAAGSHPSDQAHSSENSRWEGSVYRKPMRNVDIARDGNGTLIVSRSDNIKVERNTAYCFESR
jgi:hypothetical protein